MLCKVPSLTRVLFDIEAHNFTWDEDLRKMDREAHTLGDVCTFCFLATCLLIVAFFVWADNWDNFLMVGDGEGRDLEEDVNPLFFGLCQSESEL